MDDEAKRKRIERRILIAIVAGPLLLWCIKSGFYLAVLDFTHALAFKTCLDALGLASEFVVPLALLSVWRRPMTWRIIGVITLAIFLHLIGFHVAQESVITIFHQTFDGWNLLWSADGLAFLIQKFILIAMAVGWFAMLHRVFGFCFLDSENQSRQPRRPISIAEIMYWTAGFAVVFALLPQLLNQLLYRNDIDWPIWMIAIAFLIASATQVLPVVILALVPWQIRYRIPAAIACLIIFQIGQQLFYRSASGFQIPIRFWSVLTEATFATAGAGLALLWLWFRGENLVRLKPQAARQAGNRLTP